MKKILIPLSLSLICVSTVFAQSDSFKPQSGSKNLELQFTPFGSPVIQINGIRGRLFQSNTTALRINAFIGYTRTSTITQQEQDTIPELKDASSTISFNIRPGMEFHMSGTERLSPYVGVEADIALQSTRATSESGNSASTLAKTTTINSNGYARLGVNAIAGFDFYLAKSIYLGSELGFGLSYTKNLSTKVKSDATGFTEPDPVKKGATFNFGPNVNASIRLGYIF